MRFDLALCGGQWFGPLKEPGGDAVENCREGLAPGRPASPEEKP